MTAQELIDSIFACPQENVGSNIRRVTQAQIDYLRSLIMAGSQGGALHNGSGDSLVWMPRGGYRYVITEPGAGRKLGTLVRLPTLDTSATGNLFG